MAPPPSPPDTIPCATCGAPCAPPPTTGPALFYLSRQWLFCSHLCRLTFKRDPAGFAARHADASRPPESAEPLLPRTTAPSPFQALLQPAPKPPRDPLT